MMMGMNPMMVSSSCDKNAAPAAKASGPKKAQHHRDDTSDDAPVGKGYRYLGGLWMRNSRIVVPREKKSACFVAYDSARFSNVLVSRQCDDGVDEAIFIYIYIYIYI